MRKDTLKAFVILIVFTCNYIPKLVAQSTSLSKAKYHYEYLDYYVAIPYFKKALKQNALNNEADLIKFANCFIFTNEPEKAAPILEKLIEKPSLENKVAYLNYGKVLLRLGEYQKAKSIVKKYLSYNPKSSEAIEIIKACNSSEELMENKAKIYVQNESFNSTENDFSPFLLHDTLWFCSSRIEKDKDRYYWDNEAFISIYQVTDSSNQNVKKLTGILNSSLHEGPLAFDYKTNTLYFTRNDKGQKNKKRGDKEYLLNIYTLEYKNGNWGNLKPFKHNIPKYSTGHPAISKDGRALFFVSNRPGSLGETDVFYCRKMENGWSEPKNLGRKVNTTGTELFPTISDNNNLYFSSNQKSGLGGLDIFKIKVNAGIPTGRAQNLGVPFNSKRDDFGLIIENTKSLSGYFASNRTEGKGGDDIYYFKESKINLKAVVVDSLEFTHLEYATLRRVSTNGLAQDLATNHEGEISLELPTGQNYTFIFTKEGYKSKRVEFSTQLLNPTTDTLIFVELAKGVSHKLEGVAFDKDGNEPLQGAKVVMTSIEDDEKEITRTDQEGKFKFYPEKEKNYEIKVDKEDHFVQKMQVYTDSSNYQLKPQVALEKIEVNKVLEIENIYYEFDKYQITSQAAIILEKVVTVMQDNPTIFIELSSHTDQRGSADYNYELSKNRAQAAIEYIISKGIEKYRLTFKVYGKTKLVANCPTGDCDDNVHQLNRRTEFKVTSY